MINFFIRPSGGFFLIRMGKKEQPIMPNTNKGSDSDVEYINEKNDTGDKNEIKIYDIPPPNTPSDGNNIVLPGTG